MQVLYERCCGLDIHKRLIVACAITPGPGGRPQRELRSFGTMTADILQLGDWLAERGISQVVMESTGNYWRPIWNLLEGQCTLVLANARAIKQVPGRKTDVKDAEWLADLLRHGLVRGSFVPDRPQRELRELIRYRTSLIHERSAEINRLQKTLEGANLQLGVVVSDVTGASARAILAALLAGEETPATLAELAKGALRQKLPELQQALAGRVGPHQRFLLPVQLAHLDGLAALIEQVSAEIEARLHPLVDEVRRLDAIPGVGRATAEALLAEVGPDWTRFPSSGQIIAWAGLAPGQDESAGKRRSGRTRKGNRTLRSILVEAANAAARKRSSYLAAQFRRIAARRGKKKAAVAVAHSILVIAYHLLTRGTEYEDLGPNYYDERDRSRVERRLTHRLEQLGYRVTLEPKAA
jgi:transposase